jgi:hypothetical protein
VAKKIQSRTAKSVAAILEQELDSMITEWNRQVGLVPRLTNIRLSDADRTGHLPKLFDEVLCRLRGNKDTEPLVSVAAAAHGRRRFAQGYSVAMLVDESRIFEVPTAVERSRLFPKSRRYLLKATRPMLFITHRKER